MSKFFLVFIVISITVWIVLKKTINLFRLMEERDAIQNAGRFTHSDSIYHSNEVQTIRRQTPRSIRNALPPTLPGGSGNVGRRDPNTFPICPVCRCRNIFGRPQVVFLDNGTSRWRCHRGHRFSS